MEPNDWPEPWQHPMNPADPMAAIPSRGTRVQVLDARDPHSGQTGVVQRVTFDAGELLCTVAFDDGGTGMYWADQVLMRR